MKPTSKGCTERRRFGALLCRTVWLGSVAACAIALTLIVSASAARSAESQDLEAYLRGDPGTNQAGFEEGRQMAKKWTDARNDFEARDRIEDDLEDLFKNARPGDESKLQGVEQGLDDARDFFKGSRNADDIARRIRAGELRDAAREARENLPRSPAASGWHAHQRGRGRVDAWGNASDAQEATAYNRMSRDIQDAQARGDLALLNGVREGLEENRAALEARDPDAFNFWTGEVDRSIAQIEQTRAAERAAERARQQAEAVNQAIQEQLNARLVQANRQERERFGQLANLQLQGDRISAPSFPLRVGGDYELYDYEKVMLWSLRRVRLSELAAAISHFNQFKAVQGDGAAGGLVDAVAKNGIGPAIDALDQGLATEFAALNRRRWYVDYGTTVTLKDQNGETRTFTVVAPEQFSSIRSQPAVSSSFSGTSSQPVVVSTDSEIGAQLFGARPDSTIVIDGKPYTIERIYRGEMTTATEEERFNIREGRRQDLGQALNAAVASPGQPDTQEFRVNVRGPFDAKLTQQAETLKKELDELWGAFSKARDEWESFQGSEEDEEAKALRDRKDEALARFRAAAAANPLLAVRLPFEQPAQSPLRRLFGGTDIVSRPLYSVLIDPNISDADKRQAIDNALSVLLEQMGQEFARILQMKTYEAVLEEFGRPIYAPLRVYVASNLSQIYFGRGDEQMKLVERLFANYQEDLRLAQEFYKILALGGEIGAGVVIILFPPSALVLAPIELQFIANRVKGDAEQFMAAANYLNELHAAVAAGGRVSPDFATANQQLNQARRQFFDTLTLAPVEAWFSYIDLFAAVTKSANVSRVGAVAGDLAGNAPGPAGVAARTSSALDANAGTVRRTANDGLGAMLDDVIASPPQTRTLPRLPGQKAWEPGLRKAHDELWELYRRYNASPSPQTLRIPEEEFRNGVMRAGDGLENVLPGRDRGFTDGNGYYVFTRKGAGDAESVTGRVYVHIDINQAPQFTTFVTSQIVDKIDGVHSAKIFGLDTAGNRTDLLVIYTKDARATQAVEDALRKYPNPEHFRPGTPSMTEEVFQGVARGDDPTEGAYNALVEAIHERTGAPRGEIRRLSFFAGGPSFGSVRAGAVYLAGQDLAAEIARRAAKGELPLSPQEQRAFLEVQTRRYLNDFGIDANNPSVNRSADNVADADTRPLDPDADTVPPDPNADSVSPETLSPGPSSAPSTRALRRPGDAIGGSSDEAASAMTGSGPGRPVIIVGKGVRQMAPSEGAPPAGPAAAQATAAGGARTGGGQSGTASAAGGGAAGGGDATEDLKEAVVFVFGMSDKTVIVNPDILDENGAPLGIVVGPPVFIPGAGVAFPIRMTGQNAAAVEDAVSKQTGAKVSVSPEKTSTWQAWRAGDGTPRAAAAW